MEKAILIQGNSIISSIGALYHRAYKDRKIIMQDAEKCYVYAHIISHIIYIIPFVAGQTNKIKRKVIDCIVWTASSFTVRRI